MTVITTIEDLRGLAEKRVPRMFYEALLMGGFEKAFCDFFPMPFR